MENNDIIEVYHFNMSKAVQNGKNLYFIRPQADDVLELAQQGLYVKVADVKTQDLEQAFELTNHIDKDWQSNKEVSALTNKARSTSVGDLCVKNEEVFVVISIGFEKMPDELKFLLDNSAKQDKKYKKLVS